MHFSVLVFHTGGVDSIMSKRNYDATEDEGADIEFQEQFSAEQAEIEFKDFIKKNPKEKKTYKTAHEFMTQYNSYEKGDDGGYGYTTNTLGMCDYYSEGGRYEGLFPMGDEKQLKKMVSQALNLKTKKGQERFRDNLDEYIKIKSMEFEEARNYLKIGGCNSIPINGEVSTDTILNWWATIAKGWCSKPQRDNIITEVVYNILLERNAEGEEQFLDGGFDNEFFINEYNRHVQIFKETGEEYYLTIVDCHS